jgi:hypothetical protein
MIGPAVPRAMPHQQGQQAPFGAVGRSGYAVLPRCRSKRLGEIEGEVDRHQRVEGERKEAEPYGP